MKTMGKRERERDENDKMSREMERRDGREKRKQHEIRENFFAFFRDFLLPFTLYYSSRNQRKFKVKRRVKKSERKKREE